MANITGKLVFDQNRNGQEDVGTDVGLANVPVVLQDTTTNSLLAVNTTTNGEFEFQNVNDGTYRLVVVGDYAGNTETSPKFC
ncbi:MAG: SdrD B-like domain-containing protein [Intestinibacter bartlettii]